MRTIHKYELKTPDAVIDLPTGAKIVHFGMQSKGIGDYGERFGFYLWVEFEFNNSSPPLVEERAFSVVATGQILPDGYYRDLQHVQTIQVKHAGPETVWHLYEATPTHSPD